MQNVMGVALYGGVVINNSITSNSSTATAYATGLQGYGVYAHATSSGGGIYGSSLVENNIIADNSCSTSSSAYSDWEDIPRYLAK